MRDHFWLKKQLDLLLKKYFTDISLANPIEVRFGKEAKYRFGSIKLIKGTKGIKSTKSIKSKLTNFLKDHGTHGTLGIHNARLKPSEVPGKSVITITSLFAKSHLPVKVVQYTIAHELCHYVHGFSSTNRRLFKYPHHGGIVNK